VTELEVVPEYRCCRVEVQRLLCVNPKGDYVKIPAQRKLDHEMKYIYIYREREREREREERII
jgi:hypothetical protein